MSPHHIAPEEPLRPPAAEAATSAAAPEVLPQSATQQSATQQPAASQAATPEPQPFASAPPEAMKTETVEEMGAPLEIGSLLDVEDPNIDFDLALAATIRDTEARLAEAESLAAERHDAWLRAKAETENVRRRAQEDIAKAAKFAAEKFAGAMLPVKDSLEAALATTDQTLEKLHEGVDLTLKQLITAFENAGLVEDNPLGQKFDPNKHQAIGMVEHEAEPNTVINVLQKGYLLHGRVIRPAMVMVSRAKA